ncbi:MAG TPA: ABC transporter ATP-binding protein [Abditibacteriaceae bacterium]|jgi:ABC-2 type transport system ATP-binding protein
MLQTQGPTSAPEAVLSEPVSPLTQDATHQNAAGEIILQTENLQKVYRAPFARVGKTALHGLTINVKRGEIFGLVGPNGSGKTTTLKLLLGLIKPTGGKLEIFGRGPRDVAVKQRIGFLPDGPYFYDHLNSYEVLDFYGKLFGYSSAQRESQQEELLDMVGLNKADRHRQIRTYSKGMMQRVGLAQALINDPEFLFLDEPTTGLDPIGARQMKDAILDVRAKGKTVLLCSHLLADVQAICDRVAILSEGQLVKFGTVQELVGPSQNFEIFAAGLGADAIQQARTKGYIPQIPASSGAQFVANSSEQLDEVLTFIRDNGGRTTDVKGHSETLEDVFVRSVRSDGR